MVKVLNANDAAKLAIANMKPVADFRVAQTEDPRQSEPTSKPMPAPLERACGINQPWEKP
jgi:hypothetical protein